jgi:mRNA-degrading endonuclease toxin of MazEF toxin-antitoxin module
MAQDTFIAHSDAGYRPEEQKQIASTLSNSTDNSRSLTSLQKEVGCSRSGVFEALSDLSTYGIASVTRSNAQVKASLETGIGQYDTFPVVPPGRVLYTDLPGGKTGEQRGPRPVVVVSGADRTESDSVIGVPLTSSCKSQQSASKVHATDTNALDSDSYALCGRLQTISKVRVKAVFGLIEDQFAGIQSSLKHALDI